MSVDDIIKAWKDPEFRDSLKGQQVPNHPSGESMVELDLEQLTGVVGGATTCAHCMSNSGGSCGWFCTFTTECGCYNTCDWNSMNGCYTSYCCLL